MTKILLCPLVYAALVVASCGLNCSTVLAQIKMIEAGRDGTTNQPETIEMTVTPASQLNPIFKYRLTVLPDETTAGNAATVYMHSLGENMLRGKWRQAIKTNGEDVENWSNYRTAPAEVPLAKLRSASKLFDDYIQDHIAVATAKRECDWGYGLEDLEGPIVIGLRLNGLQETRSMARAIGLQTRVAIMESRFTDAIDLMRMNYRLGENASRSATLVGTLIGLAEVDIANGNMQEFIATPDSPNMYWALTELPNPIVEMRKAYQLESRFGIRIFPDLADAETAEHSPEEWSRVVQKLTEVAMTASYQSERGSEMKFIPTLLGVLAYAPAKQRLIDSGMEPATVEGMAVGQVLLIDANREYRHSADKLEKELYLSNPEFLKRSKMVEDSIYGSNQKPLSSFGEFLANMLLPTPYVRFVQIGAQRDIDAMRVIEAVRMHLAETGNLPKTLEDITIVPIPNNPATGKPFEYRLDGQTAILDLPSSDGLRESSTKRFKITLKVP
jgi:hypothetical protein